MRPRSITGPLILVAIGVIFLLNNLRPDFSPFALIGEYWPFLLIGAGVIGLVEVLAYAARGITNPPRPLGGGWIFWIVVWVVIIGAFSGNHRDLGRGIRIVGLNDLNGVGFLGNDYEYDVPSTGAPQVVSQGVTRVILDNPHGNLSVRGVDSADIRITGRKSIRAWNRDTADRANQQSNVTLEHQGDSIVVHAPDTGSDNVMRISTDLDIAIPKGFALEARNRNGDLTVENLDGGVTLSSGRGDVHLTHIGQDVKIEQTRGSDITADDVKGAFAVDGRGGDLDISNVGGETTVNGEFSGTLQFRSLAKPLHFESQRTEFRAEAVPGSINLSLGNLRLENVTGPVRFQSGTRDVNVADVTDALDLSVDRGDIEVAENKTPLPRMDLHSHNGDISVSVPANAAFEIHAATSRGEADNEFGSAVQTEQNGHGATLQGRVGGSAQGTPPPINATTDRGTVSFKKQ